jgi:hypothetical protein
VNDCKEGYCEFHAVYVVMMMMRMTKIILMEEILSSLHYSSSTSRMNVWLSLPLQLGTGGRRNKLFTDVGKGNEQ